MAKKKKRPDSYILDGKKYQIKWERPCKNADGRCASPHSEDHKRTIHIDDSLSQKRLATVIAHEICHAEVWCLDETTVTRMAESIVDLLWKRFKLYKRKL